ncbi:ABC transporter permease [Conexibacter sp. SYSU D00693]|uniref:ABC transporter permease n=1 Tax=Conexibacter sp. SYSU D00693 TaxID=2812560 RepID=UPI00196B35F8|nr:ABC transporter permease [Conexibacter sp. SYSU D00693]
MTALIAADLLKLRRRTGLWWSALMLPFVLASVVFLLAATETIDLDGGQQFVRDGTSSLAFIGPILAVLVGARLGSDEHAAGTLRYQLLTGVPRERLYLSKLAVLAITCLGLVVLGATAVVVFGLVLPAEAGTEGVGGGDVVDAYWNLFIRCFVYGVISFGTGALVRSTGPAITVSLVLLLFGVDLVAILVLIDDWFRHLVLDVGLDRLTTNDLDADDRVSFGAALIITVAWPAAFAFAGWLRLRNLEA